MHLILAASFLLLLLPAFAQVTIYQAVVPTVTGPNVASTPIVLTTVIPIATGTYGYTTYLEECISIGITPVTITSTTVFTELLGLRPILGN